jgi:hypothetical protein
VAISHWLRASHAVAIAAIALPPGPGFRLSPRGESTASGWVALAPARSPFALEVTADGRVVYDLDIVVHDLPAASSLGPYTLYEAWLATPNLDFIRPLGPIRNDTHLKARADWNKFTVFVSPEANTTAKKWSTVVLVGRSPSSLMQSFVGHPFYNNGVPSF